MEDLSDALAVDLQGGQSVEMQKIMRQASLMVGKGKYQNQPMTFVPDAPERGTSRLTYSFTRAICQQ